MKPQTLDTARPVTARWALTAQRTGVRRGGRLPMTTAPEGQAAAGPVVETDVLVVGSGPAGAAAALFLASYGTKTLMVTKYGRLSDSPRAHITNQRTMETLRDMGVEQRLMREATPWEIGRASCRER